MSRKKCWACSLLFFVSVSILWWHGSLGLCQQNPYVRDTPHETPDTGANRSKENPSSYGGGEGVPTNVYLGMFSGFGTDRESGIRVGLEPARNDNDSEHMRTSYGSWQCNLMGSSGTSFALTVTLNRTVQSGNGAIRLTGGIGPGLNNFEGNGAGASNDSKGFLGVGSVRLGIGGRRVHLYAERVMFTKDVLGERGLNIFGIAIGP